MTDHQIELLDAEISRHLALAKLCEEPMRNDHMELVNVFMEVLNNGSSQK